MKCSSFIFVAALMLAGVSCSREHGLDIGKEETFAISHFSACYPQITMEGDTKTEIGSVNYNDYWNIGDEVAIINVTQGYRVDKYQSISRVMGTGTNSTTFSAVEAPVGGYTYSSSDIIFAAYPYAAISKVQEGGVTRLADNKLTVSLTDNLNYISRSDSPMFAQNDILVTTMMLAGTLQESQSSYTGILFKRLTAMICVISHISNSPLNTETVSSVTLKAKGLSGTADVLFSNGTNEGSEPSIALNSGTGNTFTVNTPGNPLMASTNPVADFISVFPFWMGKDGTRNGLTILYNTEHFYVGYHREVNSNRTGNSVMTWNIFEGPYAMVGSEDEAIGDSKWWYVPKAGADLEGGSRSGEYSDGTIPVSHAGGYSNGENLPDE